MKYTPQNYAEALISALEKSNPQTVAKNFWFKLQKNGQYKDLSKIIDAIDEEYAKENDKVLAKVYSSENLSEENLNTIEQKITKEYKKEALVQNIIKKNITGAVVKVNDVEIDLSLEGKVNKLRQALASE